MRLILALCVLSAPAFGEVDVDGCYARVYDGAHLAAHPAQVVAALAVRVDRATGLADLTIKPRDGRRSVRGRMSCQAWKATTLCTADGDGGVLTAWVGTDGALILETDHFLTGTQASLDDGIDLAEGGAVTTYRLPPDPACTGS